MNCHNMTRAGPKADVQRLILELDISGGIATAVTVDTVSLIDRQSWQLGSGQDNAKASDIRVA